METEQYIYVTLKLNKANEDTLRITCKNLKIMQKYKSQGIQEKSEFY